MTDQPNQELPPARRRRLIFRAVLRGLLVTTVLVVIGDLDHARTPSTWRTRLLTLRDPAG